MLFKAIGDIRNDGWTEVIDLLDLFHRLALDMSTLYLLGMSAGSQKSGIREAAKQMAMQEFDLIPAQRNTEMAYSEAYDVIRDHLSWRSKLGSWYWLADGPRVNSGLAIDKDCC